MCDYFMNLTINLTPVTIHSRITILHRAGIGDFYFDLLGKKFVAVCLVGVIHLWLVCHFLEERQNFETWHMNLGQWNDGFSQSVRAVVSHSVSESRASTSLLAHW